MEIRRGLLGEPTQFVYRGKTYKIRASGRRTLKLLQDWKRVLRDEGTSSLMLRGEMQRVISTAPPMLMTYLLKQIGDSMTIRLLLLIVRRGRVHAATKAVFSKYRDEDPRVRRDVVRTLNRLSAWRELRRVECKCEDDDMRLLAAACQRPSFDKRLRNFARIARSYPTSRQEREVVVHPETTFTGQPARSRSQIARVLKSIRRLVRRARQRHRLIFCRRRTA